MGGGNSIQIEKQEQFVRDNLQRFKEEVNRTNNPYKYHYNDNQISGKLRQLYHNSDTIKENKRSYINEETWNNAKIKLNYR